MKDFSEELRSWGHAGGSGGQLILKADGERSIVAFRNKVARYHGGVVVPEKAARGESQCNGAAEEGGLNSDLGQRYGCARVGQLRHRGEPRG